MELMLLSLLLLGGLLTMLDRGDANSSDGGDTLAGSGIDRVFAGEGDDGLTLSGAATCLGGAGDDIIRASGTATGYGLGEDDTLLADANATISGGAGADTVAISNTASELMASFAASATSIITDFDPDEDEIGICVYPSQQDDITVTSRFDPASNSTTVNVLQAFEGEPDPLSIAVFRLEGAQGLDVARLRFLSP